ncbi:hypothetical protein [Desulfocurvus vexinensis]|uniref:hypothetical protein n=1 Tax=Desulfocurvus vexinensis TaxID=399548 RepID=UPI00048D5484|nr:hypothetical protein [Desulfocurvus vexinensis]
MKRIAALLLLALLGALLSVDAALAHSTAGLVKAPLKEKVLIADYVAFHIEPWVSARRDETGKSSRWFVLDFGAVEQRGNRAAVHYSVMDQKTGATTQETAIFLRNPDGTWSHVDGQGTVLTPVVETFVQPTNWGRLFGIAMGVLALAAYTVARVVIWRRKRADARAQAAPQPDAA